MLEEVDLCIIGSGAGGGVLAKETAEKGLKVVVLEVGTRPDPHKISTTHANWERRREEYFPSDLKRDRIVFDKGNDPIVITRFKGVGGSTMHFEGFCQRMHPPDFLRKSQFGVGEDWPLKFEELSSYYDKVENIIGLSGELDNPFEPSRPAYPNPAIPMSCAVKVLKQGCLSLGLHPCHAPLAILSRPSGSRAACNYCGGCWFGCHQGAISNVGQTYIPLAERAGVIIRERSMATRIVMNADGSKAIGVEFFDEKMALQLQRAKVIAVCGNGIETPRILLNSAPGGLANSSGQVGRNFMVHTGVTYAGRFEKRVNGYMGPNINGMLQDFYASDPKRGYLGGFLMALKNAQLGPLSFYDDWAKPKTLFGLDLQRFMSESFGHTASVGATGEVFPNPENRVSLDVQEKDIFGMPLARVSIRMDENSKSMLKHMEETVKNILIASGAKELLAEFPPQLLGTQLLGTCKMGRDPAHSVTNSYGQCHDIRNLFIVDGSIFPTSSASNVTLTIQALATRSAEYLCSPEKWLV